MIRDWKFQKTTLMLLAEALHPPEQLNFRRCAQPLSKSDPLSELPNGPGTGEPTYPFTWSEDSTSRVGQGNVNASEPSRSVDKNPGGGEARNPTPLPGTSGISYPAVIEEGCLTGLSTPLRRPRTHDATLDRCNDSRPRFLAAR